jgi:hypothetical protein
MSIITEIALITVEFSAAGSQIIGGRNNASRSSTAMAKHHIATGSRAGWRPVTNL